MREVLGEVQVGDALDGDIVVLAIWYAALDDVLGRISLVIRFLAAFSVATLYISLRSLS